MKQFLAFLIIGLMCMGGATAQTAIGVATYKVSNPLKPITGSYAQPAAYLPVSALGQLAYQIFPWYTKTDTVTVNRKSYRDTFNNKLAGVQEGVYTWCHATTASGSTASIYTLWASADSGAKGLDFVQVYSVSATSSAVNPVAAYTFPTPWLWSNYFWTINAGAGDSVLWYSGVNVR